MNEALLYQAHVINDLNSIFTPHNGQKKVIRPLFYDGKKFAFVQCGRKWGKTTFTQYALYRWAMSFPNSGCYFIAPFSNQAREILWEDNSLKEFLGPLKDTYVVGISDQQMRIRFINGSFIKVDGADNIEARRGINPDFAAFDECKDIKSGFWKAFRPNMIAKGAPSLIVGTPPDNFDNAYAQMADYCQKSKLGFHIKATSFDNPHNNKEMLQSEIDYLIEIGDIGTVKREYYAEIFAGGEFHIFPMLNKDHVIPYPEMMRNLMLDRKSWEFVVSFDPGTISCFAVLLMAVNKYDKRVYCIDEVYSTKMEDNTTKKIFPIVREKMNSINPHWEDWALVYDYAAAWFLADMQNEFQENPMPCSKDNKNKENKISMIRDILYDRLLMMSDRCKKLYWEMEGYKKDDKGKLVKENDHLLDNLRYGLNVVNYFTIEGKQEVVEEVLRENGTIESDLKKMEVQNDFYGSISSELYY